jgi:hypothetical protein
MPSLQHLLSNHFVTSTHGKNHADEIVFEYPLIQTRRAMKAGPATVQGLAHFNWRVATSPTLSPSTYLPRSSANFRPCLASILML